MISFITSKDKMMNIILQFCEVKAEIDLIEKVTKKTQNNDKVLSCIIEHDFAEEDDIQIPKKTNSMLLRSKTSNL